MCQWDTYQAILYPAGYTVDLIPGGHGEYFGLENVKSLAGRIEALAASAARAARGEPDMPAKQAAG